MPAVRRRAVPRRCAAGGPAPRPVAGPALPARRDAPLREICAAAHAVLAHQRRTPAMAADLAPAALARAVPLGARPAWAAHELTGVKFDMVLKWLSGGLIAL